MKKKAKKKPAVKIAPKKRINSRAKGKNGELELVNFLKERGFDCRRGQQYEGSSDSPDVVTNCPALAGFHIEVKRTEAGNLYNWLKQAATDADMFKMPVVAHRRSKERWVAILDFRDFLALVNELSLGVVPNSTER
jgi:Holliday junction resolvase